MSVYQAAGESVFAHQCEHRRSAVTVGWGAPIVGPGGQVLAYPALDERSIPRCPDCGGEYDLVLPCRGVRPHGLSQDGSPDGQGDHDCHPIAGHVLQSDDPGSGLGPAPASDPLEARILEVRRRKWALETLNVYREAKALLAQGDELTELEQLDAQWTMLNARQRLIAAGESDPEAA